jgi:hypothetical protein
MTTYEKFIKSKASLHKGMPIKYGALNSNLYPFQKHLVEWALRLGRAAIFADCGLGKTLMQLSWAEQIPGNVLIVAPLAVAEQTKREGQRFGIPVNICRTQDDVRQYINITNYEMIHHFDVSMFDAVVLDESSILKSFTGKIRTQLIEMFSRTKYRLACTASPSPNEHLEIGNHSEFLGVQSRTGMLATYFNHDGGETSKWRLKGHAEKPFWRWMASWAAMISKPSDLGYSDDGYILPPITRHIHTVETEAQDDVLFPVEAISLSDRRDSRRVSIINRVERLAEMVNADTDQWLIWGELNAETDAAARLIRNSANVQRSDSNDYKLDMMLGFVDGNPHNLITKTKIGGHGMNWQHCHKMAFLGMSDSWESMYQAERRCWRFGQRHPVDSHIFVTDRDGAVIRNQERKQKQHVDMNIQMKEAMREVH